MDGLEAVEVKLNEVINDNLSFRMDSEYFQKVYVRDAIILQSKEAKKLVSLAKKIDVGFVGPMISEYRNEGIKLLQTKNIDEFFMNHIDIRFINEKFHHQLSKSKIYKENILISRSGSFGKASIYLDDEVINSSDIIIVGLDKEKINPFLLSHFLILL